MSGCRCTQKDEGSYWAEDMGGDNLIGMQIRQPML